jgi:RHS repeat-associated protein
VAEQRYYPYGEERWASGTLPTDRRFTGQRWEQGLGLYDYNARWYHPYLNRWIQPDTIVPDSANPQSLNRFSYVLGNPLKYIDPTGYIQNDPNELQRADDILNLLTNDYDVKIRKDWGWRGLPGAREWNAGAWTIDELETVLQAVTDLSTAMGGAQNFRDTLEGVRIHRKDMNNPGEANANDVWLSTTTWNDTDPWSVVHELGHAWDAAHGWQSSKDMQSAIGAGFAHPIRHALDRSNPAHWYDPGDGPPPCGIDGNFNRKEDFAEAVAAYVDPQEAQRRANRRNWPYTNPARGYNYADFYATPRGQHIQALMVTPP